MLGFNGVEKDEKEIDKIVFDRRISDATNTFNHRITSKRGSVQKSHSYILAMKAL